MTTPTIGASATITLGEQAGVAFRPFAVDDAGRLAVVLYAERADQPGTFIPLQADANGRLLVTTA